MKLLVVKLLAVLACFSLCSAVWAEQQSVNQNNSTPNKSKKPAYVIESQVQGSQEQPKVIYITPWQGLSSSINIADPELAVVLPEFKPLYPKHFKQRLRSYYGAQAQQK